ncbi:MAG TPA: sigma-70 family RNA polymerase sigma factor [Thermoanaerobaculia bacterium]|nr:sigma-70 family RNA polymerase sigma factor [Thermoanaerobaculia bacterium]
MEPIVWEEFVHRHGNKLRYRVVRLLLQIGERPRPDQVEELTQEVYCRLLEGGGDLLERRADRQGELVSYLAKVTASVVIDRVREERAGKRGRARLVDVGCCGLRFFDRVADAEPNPEQDLMQRERRHLFLERCSRFLNPGRRKRNTWILKMALFEDWRSREIASALGGRMAPSSVDSLVHRAVRRLTADDRELLLG